ncbi:MAG: hypothetical protein IT444_11890 [Phycisphaeraceae bacterium]|nr:hypothetical protein [Phycisphaeraceae bacterium]
MPRNLDHIMEDASKALVKMEYLTCEALCLQALVEARRRGEWEYYARVLLPLQEVRRQRRIIAAEGVIALGVSATDPAIRTKIESLTSASIVLIKPSTVADAIALTARARQERKYLEILFADSDAADNTWTIRAFAGSTVSCKLPAPPHHWIGRFFHPGEIKVTADTSTDTPGAWFVHATERLGDAALAAISPKLTGAAKVAALEQCLEVITDHEIIHQRLADAARALSRA